jgi:outer membrane lipoprotein carrier protein
MPLMPLSTLGIRHKYRISLRTLIALLVCATSNSCGAAEAPSGRARLDEFLAALTSLTASFEQQLFDEYGELLETATGHVAIAKPGRFRWEYVQPYTQIIVTDATTLWVYDVDLEQVSINPVPEQQAGSPAALLVGDVDIAAHYDVVETAPEGDTAWVTLTPRGASEQYKSIDIGLDAAGIRGMRLRDNLNQLTAITFSDIKRNAAIPAAEFTFVPPPGVDVMTNSPAPE